MGNRSEVYWHIQMSKPKGTNGTTISSMDMLNEPQPVIGVSEWNNRQCRKFKDLSKETIILVREGNKAIALCKIISDNFTDQELEKKYLNVNYRYVEILGFISKEQQPRNSRLFSQGTLSSCRSHTQQYNYIDNLLNTMTKNNHIHSYTKLLELKKNIILQGAPGTGKTYTTASIAVRMCNEGFSDFGDHAKVMEEYERLQNDGRVAFCTFHQSMDYEDFVEGLKPEVNGSSVEYKVESGIFKSLCEQASTQEEDDIITRIDEYLQSIKGYENRKIIPTISGKSKLNIWWTEGNDTISTRSIYSQSDKQEQYSHSPLNIEKVKLQALGEGIENNWKHYAQAFINAVKKEYHIGSKVLDKPYILIIDEINRGHVSKIFGELITLLEADKRRGKADHTLSVKLPYSKEEFSVPSNLYIIGTMNTTDRSTGSLDYAVRRRFAFITLEPDAEVLNGNEDAEVRQKALALFKQINGANSRDEQSFIYKHKSADFELEDLKVGHSYFLAKDIEELQHKMTYEVIPLIKEYIKDGILCGASDDDKYFECWRKAECYSSSNQTTDGE